MYHLGGAGEYHSMKIQDYRFLDTCEAHSKLHMYIERRSTARNLYKKRDYDTTKKLILEGSKEV